MSYICSSCVVHLLSLMLAGSRPADLLPCCLHFMFNVMWSFQGWAIWHMTISFDYFTIHLPFFFEFISYLLEIAPSLSITVISVTGHVLLPSSNCICDPRQSFSVCFRSLAWGTLFAVLGMQGIKLPQHINDKLPSCCPLCTRHDASALQALERMCLKIEIPTEDVDNYCYHSCAINKIAC